MQNTVPPELKALTPYLQRAEETRNLHPIISYWCTYYALQTGLAVKSDKKDTQRTQFLTNMMDSLEKEKESLLQGEGREIVSDSDASSAFIENFALRVFANADSEDRTSTATRSTARKFLAAANFLELLKIFERLGTEDASERKNEEKIRYAKWKAGDIARALREGRTPTPGPAANVDDSLSPLSVHSSLAPPPHTHGTTVQSDSSSKALSPHIASNELQPNEHRENTSTMSHESATDGPSVDSVLAPSTPHHSSSIPPNFILPKSTPVNPGLWSNTATPGFNDQTPVRRPYLRPENRDDSDGEGDDRWSHAADIGSRQNSFSTPTKSIEPFFTSTSGPSLAEPPDPPFAPGLVHGTEAGNVDTEVSEPQVPKKVRWTPSVTGGSSTTGSPPPSPGQSYRPSLPSLPEAPPADNPEINHTAFYRDDGPAEKSPGATPWKPAASLPRDPNEFFPASLGRPLPPTSAAFAASAPPMSDVKVELSHAVVAKVQKHCRFAISSLDYEDVEQAKNELRAALALLGG